MRLLLARLIALSLVLSVMGMPLVAARAGHSVSVSTAGEAFHDHGAHSRHAEHDIPHDRSLDTARCAMACASLPIVIHAPQRPDCRQIGRLLPVSARWLPLPAPKRLERPPKAFLVVALDF